MGTVNYEMSLKYTWLQHYDCYMVFCICVKNTTNPSSQLYISEKIIRENNVNLLLIKPGNQPMK